MQDTTVVTREIHGNKSNQDEEETIKFRPSPNFKHMKKYLKSKFEEISSATKVPATHADQTNPTPIEEKPATPYQEQANSPPPSPNSSPPDSPPPEIKQADIDDEYTQYLNSAADMDVIPEDIMTLYTIEMPQATPKHPATANPIMCRKYVRGTCAKETTCKFVHELILDQLPNVYTFCRNFQNRQCNLLRCKYVHAKVFEKEYFYRTGYLPPHTLAHLKTQASPPPPKDLLQQPPPSLPPASQGQQSLMVQEIPQGYYPANKINGRTTQTPISKIQNPVPTVNEKHNIFGPSTSAGHGSSSLKRDWAMTNTSMDNSLYVQPEIKPEKPAAKKCKDCDSIEFRYQYNKNKVDNIMSSSDELTKKLNQLNIKTQRLCIVLVTLFKPESQTPGQDGLNTHEEKQKAILDQLKVLLSTNNHTMPNLQDASSKNPMYIQDLLKLLLMNNE